MARTSFSRRLRSPLLVVFSGWLALITFGASVFSATNAQAGETELLDFSSPYCGPCRQLEPTIDRLQQEGYPVRKVDVTREPALARQFRVDRVPCLVMVTGGREVNRLIGGTSYQSLKQMFAQAGVVPHHQARPVLAEQAPAIGWSNGGGATCPTGVPAMLASQAVTSPNNHDPCYEPVQASVHPQAFEEQLLATSVRIKVEDSTGHSYGTGTVIDTREGDALVITCGHLFRGEAEKGAITLELFTVTPNGLQVLDQLPGRLESFDLDRDIGLVSFRTRQPVKVAEVAANFGEQVNDRVWSVGCDRGAEPSVRSSRVTAIDRYLGPPNIEAAGAPVVGRSGGGLFNQRGELIGICYAADEQGDEGLYAGLASLHAELDRLGLQEIYRGSRDRLGSKSQIMLASAAVPAARPLNQPRGELQPLPTRDDTPIVRGQSPAAEFASGGTAFGFPSPPATSPAALDGAQATHLPPQERAALEEIGRRAADAEVVCIIRPLEPGGESEVIKLDRVSPAFLDALRQLPQ